MKKTSLFLIAAALGSASAKADVMIGAYVPGDAWDTAQISAFNQTSAKSAAFINVFSAFNHNWDQLYWQSSNVYANGAMPMISWMPVDYDRVDDNLLPEIALGGWDAYIDEWATDMMAWIATYPEGSQPTVLLRFAHEFNGNWYPYSDTPDWYTAAWQHIHNRFAALGANDHVEWVWSANHLNIDSHNDMTLYYPGDAYVDWTSLDGYNWGSNYSWTQWEDFNQVFSDSYTTLVTNYPEKPILIAEYGAAEPTELPNSDYGMEGDDTDALSCKETWSADMLATIEESYPAIRAIGLFNFNKELSWSITESTNTGLTGHNGGIASEFYTSDFISAKMSMAESVVEPAPVEVASADAAPAEAEPELGAAMESTGKEGKQSAGKGGKGGKGGTSIQASTDNTAKVKHSNRRTINAEEQAQLAASKLPARANAKARERSRAGFKGMKSNQRKKFKALKMKVIDY